MNRCAGEINIYEQDRSWEINSELNLPSCSRKQKGKRKNEYLHLQSRSFQPYVWPFPVLPSSHQASELFSHIPPCPSLSSLLSRAYPLSNPTSSRKPSLVHSPSRNLCPPPDPLQPPHWALCSLPQPPASWKAPWEICFTYYAIQATRHRAPHPTPISQGS